MADISPETEKWFADMTAAEFAAFTARVRAPDTREKFRAVASNILSGNALDAFSDAADLSKFTGDDGGIDEERVMGHLTAMFGTQTPAGGQRNWGQHSGSSGQGLRPGDGGRAEAARRAGRKPESEIETASAGSSGWTRGAAGRAEAQRRHGKKGIQK